MISNNISSGYLSWQDKQTQSTFYFNHWNCKEAKNLINQISHDRLTKYFHQHQAPSWTPVLIPQKAKRPQSSHRNINHDALYHKQPSWQYWSSKVSQTAWKRCWLRKRVKLSLKLRKTAGRGHKGQLARQGGHVHIRFEGGQTPISRRLPKYGRVLKK